MGGNAGQPRARWWERGAAALLGFVVLTASAVFSVVGSAGAAQAAPAPPGGKRNWVVSVGGLATGSQPEDEDNWVRLGYYRFAADGTVTTDFWYWTEKANPMREDAMRADCGAPEVPNCSVRTVAGFRGAPAGSYTGVYDSTADGRLRVTWTGGASVGRPSGRALTEYWNVQSGLASGGVARITSPTYYGRTTSVTMPGDEDPFSDYGATFGVGYGSNHSLDSGSRVGVDTLLTDPAYSTQMYKGAYVRAAGAGVGREGTGGDWTFSRIGGTNDKPWRRCASGACMGFLQQGAGTCRKAWQDQDAPATRVRYIGEVGDGRRNTEEYWCQGLAGKPVDGKCYLHNSHPRPMLQVIDDAGRFQGWVGAEAFTHVKTDTGKPSNDWNGYYYGVFDMVSVPALKPVLVEPPDPPESTDFTVSHGASTATGKLTWLNRSVTFETDNKVVSGCRKLLMRATGADGSTQDRSSSPLCTATTRAWDDLFDFSTVPGGVTRVDITYLASGNGTDPYVAKDAEVCTRTRCVNGPPPA
ncbi:hypothetical protein [Streptomyces lichenis]|uniref:Uncharacterized protein n=1 Tax=Streptomyces lichenis TaxID=2306967 RepID=A0ABT0I474_9ACTN|nr:hypothetical protein [Streptomyces lichenis]MCK8676113.1 hypothetical protein [Streptomyces lichenis]